MSPTESWLSVGAADHKLCARRSHRFYQTIHELRNRNPIQNSDPKANPTLLVHESISGWHMAVRRGCIYSGQFHTVHRRPIQSIRVAEPPPVRKGETSDVDCRQFDPRQSCKRSDWGKEWMKDVICYRTPEAVKKYYSNNWLEFRLKLFIAHIIGVQTRRQIREKRMLLLSATKELNSYAKR